MIAAAQIAANVQAMSFSLRRAKVMRRVMSSLRQTSRLSGFLHHYYCDACGDGLPVTTAAIPL